VNYSRILAQEKKKRNKNTTFPSPQSPKTPKENNKKHEDMTCDSKWS